MAEDVRSLLESAMALGMLPVDQVEQLTAEFSGNSTVTAEAAAAKLVEKEMLTSFQAARLLSGHGEDCVVVGRYQILEQIGSGAMGTVYRALDSKLDRPVAIKVLPPKSVNDQDAVARFQREAKALAKMSHPNIIQAYDADRAGDRHFLVMEFIEGLNLAELQRERGSFHESIAADYAYQTACGLHHAHEKGLVHRDVKPSNLFLTHDGQLKILDLGLARFLQDQIGDEGLTREGMGMGTPDYAAPEQWRSAHDVDARADIYALGCTLYHFLSGQVPFPGSSLTEKLELHKQKEPIPLEERNPELPVGLCIVVEKMMAKHPVDRFQSAQDVAEALAPFVAGSSCALPRARATATWNADHFRKSSDRKRIRKNKFAAAFVATATLLGIGFFTGPALVQSISTWLGRDSSSSVTGMSEKESSTGGKNSSSVDVITIPNGLTVAQDGTGQYKSIAEALDNAEPGMTIRVLDSATYRENIALKRTGQQAGITLEAIDGATIENNAQQGQTIQVDNVPRITVRGFRLKSTATGGLHVTVRGKCSGFVLDSVELISNPGSYWNGIEFHGVELSRDDTPVIIKRCDFRKLSIGIILAGTPDYENPFTCSGVVIRENTFVDADFQAVLAVGALERIHIVGNIMSGSSQAAIQLGSLMDVTDGMLIANNTFFENRAALRVWDTKVLECGLDICNNLALNSKHSDMIFIESEANSLTMSPGDGKSVEATWNFKHNWREIEPSTTTIDRSWIPPGELDTLSDVIPVVSRTRGESDYLRPASDSPLATNGLGNDLPSYVGALPPQGAELWDWDKTWAARQ